MIFLFIIIYFNYHFTNVFICIILGPSLIATILLISVSFMNLWQTHIIQIIVVVKLILAVYFSAPTGKLQDHHLFQY